MQLIFIIIAIFGGLGLVALGVVIGYLFGNEKEKVYKYDGVQEINSFDPNLKIKDLIGMKDVVTTKEAAENLSKAMSEPSGIIYRPTSAELDKMNEDKATKEAKEAIAETLRNEEPPII